MTTNWFQIECDTTWAMDVITGGVIDINRCFIGIWRPTGCCVGGTCSVCHFATNKISSVQLAEGRNGARALRSYGINVRYGIHLFATNISIFIENSISTSHRLCTMNYTIQCFVEYLIAHSLIYDQTIKIETNTNQIREWMNMFDFRLFASPTNRWQQRKT